MLFVATLGLGFLGGLAAGGKLDNLLAVRLRWPLLIVASVVLRLGTEAGLGRDIAVVETFRLPLLMGGYGLLALGFWANRSLPGMGLALVGIAANAFAIAVNGGYMPVWQPALVAAGFTANDALSPLHVLLPSHLNTAFLAAAGPLGDILPIPLPYLRNVLSIGDVVLTTGLSLFLFLSLVHPHVTARPRTSSRVTRPPLLPVALSGGVAGLGRLVRPRTGLVPPDPRLADGTALAALQPAGALPTGTAALPAGRGAGAGVVPRSAGLGRAARVRTHPYVRIASNGSFVSLWTGHVVSLFGDRVHQVALAFLVLGATHSAVAVSMVFVAATIPNLLFGPLAGVLVDRWDQKRVMIGSDVLRAAIVLLMPPAVVLNVLLVYPLVFLLTTVSVFFRPARNAVVPRLVADDELVTANSATWLGETIADVVGYPLAGVFVGFLGSALSMAFWVDSATYLVSAALIVVTTIPSLVRSASAAPIPGVAGLWADLLAGWRFLRHEPVLRANTLQAIVGQFTIGASVALTPIYAERILAPGGIEASTAYAFIETSVGIGNLLGGFAIGLVGARIARGRMVILGYVAYGLGVVALGLTGNVALALGLAFGMGIANMVFVIPTQTLFQERTPPEMMGRVLSFRFSAVFGSMTLAMAVSGLLGEALGVAAVFVTFGLLTMAAGLAGLLSGALRRA